MTDRLQTKFKPSLITQDGRFSGYGAVFSNTDSHGDVIMRGAFSASLTKWRAKGRWPAMRLQHGDNGSNPFRFDNLPIGRWIDMREDARGLWVEGQLIGLSTDLGRRLNELLASSLIDAMSIGFRAVKSTRGTGSVKRYLEEIDLREVSLVDEPSNDLARLTAISPSDAAFDKLRDAFTGLTSEKAAPIDAAYDRLVRAMRAATS
jgi:HK97 family phage prohead protease